MQARRPAELAAPLATDERPQRIAAGVTAPDSNGTNGFGCGGMSDDASGIAPAAQARGSCMIVRSRHRPNLVLTSTPQRPGSLSGVYVVLYFTIGAIGTALAAPLLNNLGWQGTDLAALTALLLAAALGRTPSRRTIALRPGAQAATSSRVRRNRGAEPTACLLLPWMPDLAASMARITYLRAELP
ncbi:hypothetical protein AB0L13_30935 [Saccharopolyspora shandongensis]|uniref:hypothetical protein n=1 Tax=Saccharopolyspora shandongensis TaxID=418495 RepID=UPI00343761B0